LIEEFDLNLQLFICFAGHSLGEYSALVCSESLDFLDAIYLLYERGKAMQDAVPVGQGTMIAVIGTNIKKIKELVKSLNLKKGICEIANDNADGQVIISGDVNSVEEFIKILQTNNIRCIPLKVSAPFHCSLMKPAAQIMNEKIQDVNFKVPNKEIFTNVNASPEKDPQVIKKLLVDQIFSTVRWRESIINMQNNGISNFIEIGPGKVLTGMVKRTIKNVNCFSINSIADIKKFNDKFKK
jgi:(acyl-carrier-protein) S-malonyltransferase